MKFYTLLLSLLTISSAKAEWGQWTHVFEIPSQRITGAEHVIYDSVNTTGGSQVMLGLNREGQFGGLLPTIYNINFGQCDFRLKQIIKSTPTQSFDRYTNVTRVTEASPSSDHPEISVKEFRFNSGADQWYGNEISKLEIGGKIVLISCHHSNCQNGAAGLLPQKSYAYVSIGSTSMGIQQNPAPGTVSPSPLFPKERLLI